jgi:hypothetical protein
MITSRELINVAEKRGVRLRYGDLRAAMRKLDICFKMRLVHGHEVCAYLTPGDVRSLEVELKVPFNKEP